MKNLSKKEQKAILDLIESTCISIQTDIDDNNRHYIAYIVKRDGEITTVTEPYLQMTNNGISMIYLEINNDSPEFFGIKKEGDRNTDWNEWAINELELNHEEV